MRNYDLKLTTRYPCSTAMLQRPVQVRISFEPCRCNVEASRKINTNRAGKRMLHLHILYIIYLTESILPTVTVLLHPHYREGQVS